MAEQFAAGICDLSWWNIYNSSSKGVFYLSSSPCSMAATNDGGNLISTWQTDDLMDLKQPTRSCEGLISDHSLAFLDEQLQKPKQSQSSASGNGGMMDSTLQMMKFGPSSSSTSSNWNDQPLFGSPVSSLHSVLEAEAGIGSSNPQIRKDQSPIKRQVLSSINEGFKQMKQEIPLNQQSQLISSASYDGYLYENPSISLHPHPHPQPQPQHSHFTNRSMACTHDSSNELSPSWPKISLKPLLPKPQLSGFHFSNNNTPFWNNASAETLDDVRANVFVSPPPPPVQAQYQSQNFEARSNCSSVPTKLKRKEGPDMAQVMNGSVSEPLFKRPRIDSPLPTFKVRKDKLGDRITALQQLVSPYGKTDTASVLHEAIDYIKYLHEQVSVLSAPYLNNGVRFKHRKGCCMKLSEGAKQDLRSQGLCLVPLSNTLPVVNCEMNAELWTPTYGGSIMKKEK